MTTKLIAENILDADDFSSATEQEGEFVGQPISDSGNTGAFRLLSKGDIADFSYSGTATGNGAAGGTTVVDSVLAAFGDDYFISGGIAVDYLQSTANYTLGGADSARAVETSATLITVTDLGDDEEVWDYEDHTADKFNEDFEFQTQINCTNSVLYDKCGLWAVSNTAADTLNDIDAATGDFLAVWWYEQNGEDVIKLTECNGGSITTDTSIALSKSTEYYLKIVRDESIGTYGTLYCYIYTSSVGGTLVDTLSVTLTEKGDFRYVYWMVAYESGVTGCAWSGTIQNFKIISESRTVTDFAQVTGTVTSAAHPYQVTTGMVFTLTIPYTTRDFRAVLVAGGDAGDATWKMSHDGGNTYLGRDNPDQAGWLGAISIGSTDAGLVISSLVQADNGNWLYFHEIGGDAKCLISSDKGLTWGTTVTVKVGDTPYGAINIDGRIFVSIFLDLYYSDDNGLTWSSFAAFSSAQWGFDVLNNGNIIAVGAAAGQTIVCQISTDRGLTWGAAITIAADANDQYAPDVKQAKNGNIVCVYRTDEDSASDYEIKAAISTDNGATWTSGTGVIDFVAGNGFRAARIEMDINGDLFCVARDVSNDNILISKSTDNGATWAATKILLNETDNLSAIGLALMDGHQMVCTYRNDTDAASYTIRRGIWEAFSGNACPVAIEGIEQKLICDVGGVWRGGAGIAADSWSFTPDYDFSMKNLIEDSPGKPYRSTQDNIECNIVLDLGTYERFRATGVAFFGCNVRELTFEMNASDSWGSASVSETVSFQTVTGASDANDGNTIQDTSLLASYKDHHFRDYYLRMTNGSLSGTTWKIKDNVGSFFILDTTSDVSAISNANTFEIFQSWTSATFTGGNYRFMRISIDAHNTSDDYYELGTMVVGETISLTRDFAVGYSKNHQYDIEMLRTPAGGLIPIKRADTKRLFELSWPHAETSRKEVVSMLDYVQGKNIALIPSHDTLTDSFLVKLIGGVDLQHSFGDKFNLSVNFEEVL